MSQGVARCAAKRATDEKMAALVLRNLKAGKKPEEFAGYLGLTVAEVKEIEQKALAPA